jgi:drug/metabolite transporter (DMT)-like permease
MSETSASPTDHTPFGILLIIVAVTLFAIQDGFSRYLAGTYNTLMVVAVRYWFFAAVVVVMALRRQGGLRAMRTGQPMVHVLRATLLVAEVCTIIYGYTLVGLVESHAVFACCPLLVAALAGPVLGEKVGWRRWAAIGTGFAGVLIILQPGGGVFQAAALLPLAAALMYALYSLLTRRAGAADDSLVSLFWAAVIGAALMTPVGIWNWQPMAAADWGYLIFYCLLATLATWIVIHAYSIAEASALQPFIYLQLVLVTVIGVTVFGERLRPEVVAGSAIVVAAGVFTILRTRRRGGQALPRPGSPA